MSRRIHVHAPLSTPGQIVALDPVQAHHVRDVLRLKSGHEIELFDDAGNLADAVVEKCDPDCVSARVQSIRAPALAQTAIVIASAVPKGDRADWMIQKLSELGVSRFIPLATARSVVLPSGKNKHERWVRIATEAAKQSRRAGVMQIDELTPVQQVLQGQKAEGRGQKRIPDGLPRSAAIGFLSTQSDAVALLDFFSALCPHPSALTLLVGPEGGWSEDELSAFETGGLTGVKLTATILRVETAAIAAAAVLACLQQTRDAKQP